MYKKTFWILVCAFALFVPLLAVQAEPPAGAGVRAVLEAQAAAWNRGDLDAFMSGYARSETTTFVGSEVTKGYQKVLNRYRERYATPEKMGKLAFTDLEVKMLGTEYASAVGRWQLKRSPEAGGDVGGLFTLLFQKTREGWKIILDHTS